MEERKFKYILTLKCKKEPETTDLLDILKELHNKIPDTDFEIIEYKKGDQK